MSGAHQLSLHNHSGAGSFAAAALHATSRTLQVDSNPWPRLAVLQDRRLPPDLNSLSWQPVAALQLAGHYLQILL